MFKPLTRSNRNSRSSNGEFAQTTFVHSSADDDYSGFAPTEMFEDADHDAAPPAAAATAQAARAAASTSRTALERAAGVPASTAAPLAAAEQASIPQSWVTSQWVAAQEAKAHEAASQARAVIAAQRRAGEEPGAASGMEAAAPVPRTGLARLRAAFGRLLPGEFRSLLPLFIGVSVTMALISAVLPLFDKP